MERRYALLSENGARSLAEFNKRAEEGASLRRSAPVGAEDDPERWTYTEGPLPFIVLVVDELADLMMTVQAEIEKPLAQLAQKSRAIGIHLVVATQRPSVNVITGLIKANFPCRIAFRVSSKVDSRTIIDQNGADALLGNGDMLFLPPGTSDPVRIQGAYISTEDTEQMMDWYRAAEADRPAREEDILEMVRAREAEEAGTDEDLAFFDERDALFRQAAEICVQFQQGSTSLLQRRLRIGYGRAARIIDQLHHAGVLGPPDGSKPREVLVGMESIEHICGE
jgi:DNA segregation ATPase FtsK/SpoIIIE, S-DNA-T family